MPGGDAPTDAVFKDRRPGAAVASELIGAAAQDRALAERAAALGHWHRNFLTSNNALSKCEATCRRLLG